MRRFVKALTGLALGLAVASCGIYFLGPHIPVSAAFETYKTAYLTGDVAKVTALTTQADIAFWDEQRRHALRSPEEVVKAQDYKQRAAILKLRSDVYDGKISIEDLEQLDQDKLYAASREPAAFGKAMATTSVLFAVPTGRAKARGYLRFGSVQSTSIQIAYALFSGAYLNFVTGPDGTYKIDPTPLLDQGAKQMEALAIQVDPTGNKFIVQGLLRAEDANREQKLWAPLIRE